MATVNLCFNLKSLDAQMTQFPVIALYQHCGEVIEALSQQRPPEVPACFLTLQTALLRTLTQLNQSPQQATLFVEGLLGGQLIIGLGLMEPRSTSPSV
jgi:hypothetical protein